jgi:hypothetical protein
MKRRVLSGLICMASEVAWEETTMKRNSFLIQENPWGKYKNSGM